MKQKLIFLLFIFIICSSCTTYKKIDTYKFASISDNTFKNDLKQSILEFKNDSDSIYIPTFLK